MEPADGLRVALGHARTAARSEIAHASWEQKGMTLMMTRTAKSTVALGLVGALAMAGAGSTWAAAVPSNTAAVKAAVSVPATEVRFRHHGFGPGAAIGGLALGLAGAALAAPYYYAPPPSYGYAYDPDYYYYYDTPGYAYAPAPYAWGPHYRHWRHWRHW